jgi:hypothetical protein
MRLARCNVTPILIAAREPSRVAILLLGVIALCSACAASASGGAAAPAPRQPSPAVYSATARVQPGAPTTVSVSCHPGEQMLGGGFRANNLFEYAAVIEASYPSGVATWTVTGSAPASYFDLEADVFCLPATIPLGVRVVHATGAPAATAACPPDTVLLGGGFQAPQPIGVSRPQGNGWLSASLQVYALCAAHHVQRGQVVTAAFNAHSSSHSYFPGEGDAACLAGQIAVGGGYDGGDLILASQTRGPSFTGWSVSAGGDADVTVAAVCVLLQA